MLPPRPSPLQLDMRWEFKPVLINVFDLGTRSEKADFLIVWSFQKMIYRSEKAFSDHIRSEFWVPDQKSRFLTAFF